ncbi:hypothetical protein LOTGIDRAFT_223843 [Lottia gigantea]|uniref:Hsp90 chaperone protein kinase-targeting subunit n=1 Tax=Lottia gigantea TaxID=225164 RepID=V4BF79_LOTGI|nr:hypothetical protein LOTGIDRAFT_223843 [Lottia gigantea]ESP04472.1 hypothetical protein LOTGIDRAFT_223843 [Lottia gigantea]
MTTINYSKWDHIDISDDEDDTHPNIDTASLFKWKHEARLERMAKQKEKREEFEKGYTSHNKKMSEIKKKLKEVKDKEDLKSDFEKLNLELSELEKQEREWKKKEEELKQEEKLTPLNIDTICKEGMSKTVINKAPPKPEELTDEEKAERQKTFVDKHKAEIKKYGMMKKYQDSQQFLSDHPYLVCEETANYLVLWCIDLEIEEKHDLMDHVAHQVIVMQFILELAKTLERDPRSCVRAFFARIEVGEKQYQDAFNDELNGFKSRIKARAKTKIDEAMKEYEEQEKKKRLGPGGLDPVDVMETLPQRIRECFENQDLGMLKERILELSQEQAEYHIKRCVDSGLWVPNAAEKTSKKPTEEDGEEEEFYEAVE